MAKTASPDLFLLIRSLSKHEKGYIRTYAFGKRQDDPKFMRLFTAIERLREYDETALLKSETYIRQLPRMKMYLYERILDALDNYYSVRNAQLEVRKVLNRITILFEKGLYDACIRQLPKAKELASRYEFFGQWMEAISWERTLMLEKQLVENFAKVEAEERLVITRLEELAACNVVYDQINKLYSESIWIRSEADHRKYKTALNAPVMRRPDAGMGVLARVLRYKARAKYYSALDERKRYLEVSRRAVELFDSDPAFTNQHLLAYIKALNNLIATLGENDRFQEFDRALEKLRSIPDRFPAGNSEKMRSMIRMRVLLREFYQNLYLREYDKAGELTETIEERLQKDRHLISAVHAVIFQYALSYIHFINGDYRKSLRWINAILNLKPLPVNRLFQGYARVLGIILHFELGDVDMLQSLVPSALRFFDKRPDVYPLERMFIHQLWRKVVRTSSDMERKKRLQELGSMIRKSYNPNDNRIMEYFDFLSWIDSRVRNVPFAEALREKRPVRR
ncbi:MAG: hypothetical protein KBA16_03985 [Bacteroidia bacterium]|jgi:tetratricopeptide (TPR) repeat protein|nr:hypothetical protein [Bacteroidia bacterium]MBP7436860.1 hypothetical protein [Bacteroidia bacterium]